MVRAWYMDDSDESPLLPHMTDPPRFLDIEELKRLTGCLYYKLDSGNYSECLEKIKSERGCTYEDVCNMRRPNLPPNYDVKRESNYHEHMHPDEEVRYCADGSGYFDARDVKDRWIRIELSKDDLLVLPAGIYHRFTLDSKNYMKLGRLFVGEPVWTPINRPAENHPARQAYLKEISSQVNRIKSK